MLVRLSSKGQIIIPLRLRQALGLEAGTRLFLRLDGRRIVVEPEIPSPVATLFGKVADADLLTDLETEHRQEVEGEAPVGP